LKYLIELTNRGESSSYSDNVLLNDDKIYVMDNHRLALWCWFQEIKKQDPKLEKIRYNIFHIDAHPDQSTNGISHVKDDLFSLSLEDYRSRLQEDINIPLYRWDNYLEIFLQKYPELVAHTISATHHLGSKKTLNEDVKSYNLLKRVSEIFSEKTYLNKYQWIMNLDLDYFYSSSPEKVLMFNEEWLKAMASAIHQGIENNLIAVCTISLSPECCGSWEKAEAVLKYFYSPPLGR